MLKLPKITNDSGIILMIVLIILMVMAIFSVSIFSQSMSQGKTSHSQVEQIVAEQLAKGAFWRSYNSEIPGGSLSNTGSSSTVNLNGRTYTIDVSQPSGNQVQASVTY